MFKWLKNFSSARKQSRFNSGYQYAQDTWNNKADIFPAVPAYLLDEAIRELMAHQINSSSDFGEYDDFDRGILKFLQEPHGEESSSAQA